MERFMTFPRLLLKATITAGLAIIGFASFAATNEVSVQSRLQQIQRSSGFKPNYKSGVGGECFGFANNVYNKLFGLQMNYNHLNDGKWSSQYRGNTGFYPEPSHSRIIGSIRNRKEAESSNYAQLIKAEFRKAYPNNAKSGSFVQMAINNSSKLNSKGEPRPHSAIIYQVNNNGVKLYDANSDNNLTVKLRTLTWRDFARQYVGFTIYEPKNYKLK